MVYLIDMRIRYRTDDGAIWLQDDEGSLTVLTVIMNRLLSYLIEQRGQVVTRDELLQNVWDIHGLHSSNHTLTKYLSELRKQFKNFGVTSECITTIPKIGFMFNGDVDVSILTEEPQEHAINNDSAEPRRSKFIAPPPRYGVILAAMACCAVALGLYFLPLGLGSNDNANILKKDTPTFFLFDYGHCPVYTIQKNSDSLMDRKKNLFLKLVSRNNIACLSGTSFLYQVSESYLYGHEGRAFISRCTTKDNEYISCLNYYWSGHEGNV